MPTKLLDKSLATVSLILLLSALASCSRVVQIAEISAIAKAAGAAITIVAIQNATERQSQVALQQGRFAYGQIKGKQDSLKPSPRSTSAPANTNGNSSTTHGRSLWAKLSKKPFRVLDNSMPHNRVQGTEWLIQKEDTGLNSERPRQRNPLPLAA